MTRLFTFVGGVAAVGLAVATAGWEPIAVAHTSDGNRRGRLEFRHSSPEIKVDLTDVTNAADPASVDPKPATPEVKPDVKPEPKPEPKAEPDIVSVTDVKMGVVENAELPDFKVKNSVRIHFDSEGVMYWTTPSKQTELSGQKILLRNLGSNHGRKFIIVPDQLTGWQYVKDTLATADQASTQDVYLGVAGVDENKTVLRLLRVMPAPSSFEAMDGDFVIHVANEDGDLPTITVNGDPIENFPIDLAMAWSDWKKANPDADTTYGPNTRVVLGAHRFAMASHVAQVIGVLRGLDIECEKFVGNTSFGGRKRK